ncbi:hypothetical protein GN956_G17872 [Arapaima gigas]
MFAAPASDLASFLRVPVQAVFRKRGTRSPDRSEIATVTRRSGARPFRQSGGICRVKYVVSWRVVPRYDAGLAASHRKAWEPSAGREVLGAMAQDRKAAQEWSRRTAPTSGSHGAFEPGVVLSLWSCGK